MYDYFICLSSDSLGFLDYESGKLVKTVNNPTALLNMLRGGKTFICSSSLDFPEEYTDSYDVLSLVKTVKSIASGENSFELL